MWSFSIIIIHATNIQVKITPYFCIFLNMNNSHKQKEEYALINPFVKFQTNNVHQSFKLIVLMKSKKINFRTFNEINDFFTNHKFRFLT